MVLLIVKSIIKKERVLTSLFCYISSVKDKLVNELFFKSYFKVK